MGVNNCSYWRPKVNDKFYSLWSNNFGKTQPHWQWSKILKIMVWRMQTWKYWTKILKISESHISATSATMYLPIQAIWGHSGERSDKCNLCDFASSQAGDLRRHLKIHSALCVFVNGELVLGFLELLLSFYGCPNISDRFTFHFIRIQIFQIDFPLILYL